VEVVEELVVGELSRSARIMHRDNNLAQDSKQEDAPTQQQLVEPFGVRQEAMRRYAVKQLKEEMQEEEETAFSDPGHLHP